MKRFRLLPVFLATACGLLPITGASQGWKRTFPDRSQPFAVRQTSDGGAAFVASVQGVSGERDLAVVKTDADGLVQWEKMIGGQGDDEGRSLDFTADQCLIVTGRKSFVANNSDVYLAKLAPDGNLLWENTYNYGILDDPKAVRQTPDGGYALALNADNMMRLLKTDAAGAELWSLAYPQTTGQSVNHLEVDADGGLLVTLLQSNLPLVAPIAHVIKTGADGQVLFQRSFQHLSNYSTADIARAKPCGAGQYLLVHRDSVYRLDADGVVLHAFRIGPLPNFYLTDVVPDADGGFRAYGTNYAFAPTPFSALWFGRFDAANNALWERSMRTPHYLHTTLAAEMLVDKGSLLTGYFVQNGNYFTYLLRTDTLGQLFTNLIEGDIYWDKNPDCARDAGEPALPGWVLRIAHPNGEVSYAMTDSLGHYRVETGTGAYAVSVFPPNSLWETDCAQDVQVQFDSGFTQTPVHFPVGNSADCPLTWVDLGMTDWIPCVERTVEVRYANRGTAVAADAGVRLTLDSLLAFAGASIPYIQTDVRTYLFPLGDLAALQNGHFDVRVVPACDGLIVGQSRCIRAEMAPDAPCLSPLDGPLIVASGRCDADGVHFLVENKGAGMNTALEFVIIEDNIMYLQPTPFQLGPGQNTTFSYPANGSTWRFEAYQAPGTPDWQSDTRIAAVVEGCTTDGAFSTGFFNQFSLFDGGSFIETECREVTSAPSGTGKTALPSGYENEHFISPDTDIEYTLYFRNTTGAVVNSVVLRDTIDTGHLNVASVEPGPASHPYHLSLQGAGILIFRFDSIGLAPDAQGWVKFRIAQQPGLPNGAVILNSATVGFDFGAPVATNETWHTVAGMPPVGALGPSAETTTPFAVYPVPTADAVFIEMPAAGRYHVQVSDLYGKTVLESRFEGRRAVLGGAALPAGVFLVRIVENDRPAGTARIVKTN